MKINQTIERLKYTLNEVPFFFFGAPFDARDVSEGVGDV